MEFHIYGSYINHDQKDDKKETKFKTTNPVTATFFPKKLISVNRSNITSILHDA
jgi:hypothetical protein